MKYNPDILLVLWDQSYCPLRPLVVWQAGSVKYIHVYKWIGTKCGAFAFLSGCIVTIYDYMFYYNIFKSKKKQQLEMWTFPLTQIDLFQLDVRIENKPS